jgi:hypothetical protein
LLSREVVIVHSAAPMVVLALVLFRLRLTKSYALFLSASRYSSWALSRPKKGCEARPKPPEPSSLATRA